MEDFVTSLSAYLKSRKPEISSKRTERDARYYNRHAAEIKAKRKLKYRRAVLGLTKHE